LEEIAGSFVYVVSGLQGEKMERRLRENQIPTGFFCEQIVFKVEEAAQLSGRSIRHKVKNLVSQVNIPPQTGQQNGGNRSRVTVEMSPGVRLQVQAVE
jgi:hypothetical protein